MQTIHHKITKLEEQKAKLDQEIAELQQKKNEEFLTLLNKIPTLTLDPFTLIGGLLHVVEEANKKPELKEKWRMASQKFCGRASARKGSSKGHSSTQKVA